MFKTDADIRSFCPRCKKLIRVGEPCYIRYTGYLNAYYVRINRDYIQEHIHCVTKALQDRADSLQRTALTL